MEITESKLREIIREIIQEIKKKRVVRGGKRTIKKQCRPGYKLVNGKCVKMSSKEKKTRSRSQRKASKKRKSKSSQIARKRKKSMKKRK